MNDATDATLLATLGRTAQEIGTSRDLAAAFAILERAAAKTIGHRMFTALLYHSESGLHEPARFLSGRRP